MVDIEKARRAGVVAQSALAFIVKELHKDIGERSIGEICRAGDEFIRVHAAHSYKTVAEKGIALPVQICKNELTFGVAPEATDVFQGGVVLEGDIVKISLGVHIDGYTAQVAHTVVVREGAVEGPVECDAAVGAFLATEAVVSLLGSVLSDQHPLRTKYPEISGKLLREAVDSIAKDFDLAVVPGSRIRRVKRFVAGQITVQDDLDCVEWPCPDEVDEFVVKAGQSWLVDIQFASLGGSGGTVKVSVAPPAGSVADPAAIYCRDHTVTYNLRTQAARTLLSKADGVFPFKLSQLGIGESQLRLGLSECLQRHLLIALPIERAMLVSPPPRKESVPVETAREMTTVVLVSGAKSASGFPEALRLGGGRQTPPSWVHSRHELGAGVAADALNARIVGHLGVKYLDVTGSLPVPLSAAALLIDGEEQPEPVAEAVGEMDVEM